MAGRVEYKETIKIKKDRHETLSIRISEMVLGLRFTDYK